MHLPIISNMHVCLKRQFVHGTTSTNFCLRSPGLLDANIRMTSGVLNASDMAALMANFIALISSTNVISPEIYVRSVA